MNAGYILVAIGLGLLVPHISVGATVQSRRVSEMLVAVGAASVPFIATIYSLLFLVVQFSSTALTPRLNLFRDSPIVWHAFSFFTSVIVFAFHRRLSPCGFPYRFGPRAHNAVRVRLRMAHREGAEVRFPA